MSSDEIISSTPDLIYQISMSYLVTPQIPQTQHMSIVISDAQLSKLSPSGPSSDP